MVDASCNDSECSLQTALMALRFAYGQPMSIHVTNGTYSLLSSGRRRLAGSPAPAIDFSTVTASEVWISGDGGGELLMEEDGAQGCVEVPVHNASKEGASPTTTRPR